MVGNSKKRRNNMAKCIWRPLEKDHPIFTKSFSTYTPRTSRKVQDATRKIPKWLLGRETLYCPKRKGGANDRYSK